MSRIQIGLGDISMAEADVIVSAASPMLDGSGGVERAIMRRGGDAITEQCRRIRAERFPRGLPVGQAVATTGGRLSARWIVHVVAPTYATSASRSWELARCFRDALRVAAELAARSVVLPSLATDLGNYPLPEAARASIEAVRSAGSTLDLVRFVLDDRPVYWSFVRAFVDATATGGVFSGTRPRAPSSPEWADCDPAARGTE